MIVVFFGKKGGDGKSTSCINTGINLLLDSQDPVIVDIDYQRKEGGSSGLFSQNRDARKITPRLPVLQKNPDERVAADLQSLKKKFTHVLVDAGGYDSTGARTSLLVADIVITPMQPDDFSTNTLPLINETVKDAMMLNPKLKPYLFFNMAKTNSKQKNDLDEHLDVVRSLENKNHEEPGYFVYQICKTVLFRRSIYGDMVVEGRGVPELHDKKASNEFNQLYQEIFHG